MSVQSGQIVASPGGKVLTFVNTGSYSLPFVSQILTVYNSVGQVAYGPFDMGQNLSQAVDITADGYLSFVNVITDQNGSIAPIPVNYDAIGIYQATYLNRLVSIGCGCQPGQFCTMFKAQLNLQASLWFAIPGLGVQAESTIVAANTYINMNNAQVVY